MILQVMYMSNKNKTRNLSKKISFLAILFVMSTVLSYMESIFTAGLSLPLGIKPGLSNIITMYSLFFIGKKEAYTLSFLKSFFVFLTRGPSSAILSICGGTVSITIMIILSMPKKLNLSYTMLSIAGALSHNIAQMIAASYIQGMGIRAGLGLMPILVITGIIMGVITGYILNMVLPTLEKLGIKLS